MWCCDDWWAHACGGTAAAGRSLSRFSLRALGRHTHARTHHLMMVRSLLSGGASRGPCLSSAQLACEAPTPKQTSPCRWYDPIRSMESVIDASADIWSGGVRAWTTHIHSYRKRMACAALYSGMHATRSSGFVLTAEDERGSWIPLLVFS